MTLQHMGHSPQLYGTIKLSAERCELFPLHRSLYPLLTIVPLWHLIVFKNIFTAFKLSCHLCSAPRVEAACWYCCLSCGCMRSSTWGWSALLSWDSRSCVEFEGCGLRYAFWNDGAVQNMPGRSFRRPSVLLLPTRRSTTVKGRDVPTWLLELKLKKTRQENSFKCYQGKEMGDRLNALLKIT